MLYGGDTLADNGGSQAVTAVKGRRTKISDTAGDGHHGQGIAILEGHGPDLGKTVRQADLSEGLAIAEGKCSDDLQPIGQLHPGKIAAAGKCALRLREFLRYLHAYPSSFQTLRKSCLPFHNI